MQHIGMAHTELWPAASVGATVNDVGPVVACVLRSIISTAGALDPVPSAATRDTVAWHSCQYCSASLAL
jgi:hypothetical protein